MKLIVQIPCHNEAETLPLVLASIPRRIAGVDRVEVLVVDDGSTDETAEIARRLGVEHVVRHRRNRGLAKSFKTGIDACLRLGADLIVNTDGDNQYRQADIPRLIAPIVEGRADIVIGDRRVQSIPHFTIQKKALQKLGTSIVRMLSGTSVPDAPSGFRAFSREAALRLNVISTYSYTLETLIQAGAERMAIEFVEVGTNPQNRESRLFRSVGEYVRRSMATMLRAYSTYKPLTIFFAIGSILVLLGAVGVLRFVYFYFSGTGSGHVQSVVLSTVFLIVGFQVLLIGLLADLIASNRRLIEEVLYRVRRLESESASEDHEPEASRDPEETTVR